MRHDTIVNCGFKPSVPIFPSIRLIYVFNYLREICGKSRVVGNAVQTRKVEKLFANCAGLQGHRWQRRWWNDSEASFGQIFDAEHVAGFCSQQVYSGVQTGGKFA